MAGSARQSTEIMTDNPVNLDNRRGMAAQRDTETRRAPHDVQTDQAALRGRQEELENFLDAAPPHDTRRSGSVRTVSSPAVRRYSRGAGPTPATAHRPRARRPRPLRGVRGV